MSICPSKQIHIVHSCFVYLSFGFNCLFDLFSVQKVLFLHHLFSASMVEMQGFRMHYVLNVPFLECAHFISSSYTNLVSFFRVIINASLD